VVAAMFVSFGVGVTMVAPGWVKGEG